MPPKTLSKTLQTKAPESRTSNDAESQSSKSQSGSLSVISETSSMLMGSVASAASKVPLKASKVAVRDRKIVFWTPVMIWPAGFAKTHRKETVQYKSDECLHNGKMPYVAVKLAGGVIIDLTTSDVAGQVRQLVELSEIKDDSELRGFLQSLITKIKTPQLDDAVGKSRRVELLGSELMLQLPLETQSRIRSKLQEGFADQTQPKRFGIVRKRDQKASLKLEQAKFMLDAT